MLINYEYEGHVFNVDVEHRDGRFYVTYDGNTYTATAEEVKKGHLKIQIGDRMIKSVVSEANGHKFVFIDGDVFKVKAVGLSGSRKDERGDASLKSPISGRVVEVKVSEGERVEKGDVLLVIESMKMEYLIKAPYAGVVEEVRYKKGDQIEIGEQSVTLRKEEE